MAELVETANIGYSITVPTTWAERLACGIKAGGLGGAHHRVTQEALKADRRIFDELQALNLRHGNIKDLIGGMLWPDMPIGPINPDNTADYFQYMERVESEDAQYLDEDFRWQPLMRLQWALGAVYTKKSRAFMKLVNISDADIDLMTQLLAYRTAKERTHYHFMLESATDTTAQVCERAILQTVEWMGIALRHRTLHYVGMCFHEYEDSCSTAHTERLDHSSEYRFGAVKEAYFFENQTDHSHSLKESIRAIMRPGSVEAKRVRECGVVLREMMWFFINTVKKVMAHEDDPAQQEAIIQYELSRFAERVKEYYVYAGRNGTQ